MAACGLRHAFITAAYFTIPLALYVFAQRRPDFTFHWLLWMFSAFIGLCGLTHLFGVWTVWHPDYAVEGGVKFITGAVSMVTAVLLWRIIPTALALPSPSQLSEKNQQLEQEITEHNRTEAELRHLQRELEARIEERTAQLQRSNTELERYAYAISHDLQEPLRMVSGYTGLLQGQYWQALDEKGQEYLQWANEGAIHMGHMLDDLLRLSRVERADIQDQTVDMNAAVQGALANLQDKIGAANAEITVSPLPQVVGSQALLSEVFQNLIANAIKYRSEAAPKIDIDVQDQGEYWQIRITDNGLGMEPKQSPRALLPFQRLHDKRLYQGTGMGLTIVQQIIERHQGSIQLDTAPDQGTTVIVNLPKNSCSETHLEA